MKNFTFTENFRSPIVEKIIDFYEEEDKSLGKKVYPTRKKIVDINYSIDNPNNG